MNRIKLFLITIASASLLFSCKKDDDSTTVTPPRDRAEQYAKDLTDIEVYLDTHYLTVTIDANNNPVPTITKIPVGGTQVSIMDQTEYPLLSKTLRNDVRNYTVAEPLVGTLLEDPVEYKVYYLQLREGIGQKPTQVDSTFISYKGFDLDGDVFDSNPTGAWLVQDRAVSGWRQIVKEFKTGNAGEDPQNPGGIAFTDHGVGIMFVPSGLGYFSTVPTGSSISSYSPLVFIFNLHKLKERDNDGDGVLSKDEDLNGNGNYYDDDTDGDGIPNFLDTDDDGDGTLTRKEVSDSFGRVYAFDLIPNCAGTTGGLKRHLDPSCK